MNDFLLNNQWEIFIVLEVIMLVSLILAILFRYISAIEKWSTWLFGLFFIAFALEAYLAYLSYVASGEITTFQIIIFIFIGYLILFGWNDFRNLDLKIKRWLEKRRGIILLTEKERTFEEKKKTPGYVRQKSFVYFILHSALFAAVLSYFWFDAGAVNHQWFDFIKDFSWYEDQGATPPFEKEVYVQITQVWLIVYVIDTLINVSYILFPGSGEKDKA